MNKHIQKALLGTSAAALALATSCGGDDVSPDLLVGEWELEFLDGGPSRIFGGTITYTYSFNFASDGTFGNCYSYFNDGVLQDKDCYQYGEWEWIVKNRSAKLIDAGGPRRQERVTRLDGGPFDIIFSFAELDGDSFLAVVGADTDSDGDLDYVYTVLQATRVGDAAEWTEMQP